MENLLIRVSLTDEVLGGIEKMKAHRDGVLHRAFSVFLFSPDGRWLMQQRAFTKYHSAGLWSNACCGHPLMGEDSVDAARSRLQYEMGLTCDLSESFSFVYRAELDSGMTEYEFDHVFLGVTGEEPHVHPAEVAAWQYMDIGEIRRRQGTFTHWFNLVFERVQSVREQLPQ